MNKLNILICEDTAKHLEAAREQLAEHNVFTASTLVEAMGFLGNKVFEDIDGYRDTLERKGRTVPVYMGGIDIVLSDMYMPGGNMPIYELGDQLSPVGVMIALRAASLGVKFVGVMTDANHHSDAMTCGIDMINGAWFSTKRPLIINQSKVVFTTTKMIACGSSYVKDWRALLDGLLAE